MYISYLIKKAYGLGLTLLKRCSKIDCPLYNILFNIVLYLTIPAPFFILNHIWNLCHLNEFPLECLLLLADVLIGHFVSCRLLYCRRLSVRLSSSRPIFHPLKTPHNACVWMEVNKTAFYGSYCCLCCCCSICFHGHLRVWAYAAIKLNVM